MLQVLLAVPAVLTFVSRVGYSNGCEPARSCCTLPTRPISPTLASLDGDVAPGCAVVARARCCLAAEVVWLIWQHQVDQKPLGARATGTCKIGRDGRSGGGSSRWPTWRCRWWRCSNSTAVRRRTAPQARGAAGRVLVGGLARSRHRAGGRRHRRGRAAPRVTRAFDRERATAMDFSTARPRGGALADRCRRAAGGGGRARRRGRAPDRYRSANDDGISAIAWTQAPARPDGGSSGDRLGCGRAVASQRP